ncbi:response regulator transcription factor [Marinobacterium sp. MBR-109]|jgi:CheY-like chemotaxis protein|uniref:response regulator n=1 Tax=Marinobacterium sp. MBR-109 TaxID=3156462 RepID=UPI003399E849
MNRILIIDDDSDCAQLAQLQLQQLLGDQVETCLAPTLEDSIQLMAHGFEPNLVMLDLNLPDGAGVECVARIRARLPNTPILIMTGRDRDHVVAECLAGGANGYLQKGCGLERLSDAISIGISPEVVTPH